VAAGAAGRGDRARAAEPALLEAEDRRRRDDEPINGLLAAQLLAAVAATHEVGGAGHPRRRLVTDFGLTPDNVERVVARLKQRGLIGEVRGDINGYVPARPAATIHLDEVLSAFRSSDIEIAHGATAPSFAKLVGELEDGRRRRIAGVTIADLMPLPDGSATTTPRPSRRSSVRNRRRVRFASCTATGGGGDVLSAVGGRGGGRGGARWSRAAPRPRPRSRSCRRTRAGCTRARWPASCSRASSCPSACSCSAPNHTGRGPRASVWSRGRARRELAAARARRADRRAVRRVAARRGAALRADRDAHEDEHAIEVLLPLIAARQPKLRLAAIVLGGQSYKECEALGAGIARRRSAR
jgi:DNA-binding IscR family transcriptional regulator